MAKSKPILKQQIFEARYEQGYRYLDRCGDALVILEDLLSDDTGHVWMANEMAPSGAKLKCPDLDIVIAFTSNNLVVEQNPIGQTPCDLLRIAQTTLATLTGRFDLRKMRRYGRRQVKLLPANSIEEAEGLSVQYGALDWSLNATDSDFEPHEIETLAAWATRDRSKGMRAMIKPYAKIGAAIEVDERLRIPPRHLPDKQHEALVEQLKRRRLNETDPEAGLLIDTDYYWMWPSSDQSVEAFFQEAEANLARLEGMVLERSKK